MDREFAFGDLFRRVGRRCRAGKCRARRLDGQGLHSDASREVANRGVQVHGGIGFTWEHDLQLYYKRSKASEILFGDASHHRAQLADLVFVPLMQICSITPHAYGDRRGCAREESV